jgi:hypothetical protein
VTTYQSALHHHFHFITMSPTSELTNRNIRTIPWAIVGGILSIYALYVESMTHRRHLQPEAEPFVALCDIEQIGASCRYVAVWEYLCTSRLWWPPTVHTYSVIMPLCFLRNAFLLPYSLSFSNVFQLPQGRMLTYFGIVPQGSILDVPNALLGWIYYTLWVVMIAKVPKSKLIFVQASLAMASSVWLAVQLLLLHELCLLCWSTHVINARLWWFAYSNIIRTTNTAVGATSVPKEKKIKRV